jgi:glycogen(starch) synthase
MSVRRVAFLSSEYPPHTFGGLGTTVEALSRFLAARGIEVLLVVPDQAGYAVPPPGVRLLPVTVAGAVSDEDFWLTFCEQAYAAVIHDGADVDLVHCHDWMTTAGGIGLARAYAVPVVLTVHLPQTVPGNLALENLGLRACDAVVVNSAAVRDELAGRAVRADFATIANGVDLARFAAAAEPPDLRRVFFAGRLVPQKGVDVLLRAFGAVLRRHPDAALVLAGDGEQRLYLERLANFLGIRRHVTFLGWTAGLDLPALYRSAVVTAVPSLYEPFGLVALEAMACGRPVVAARVGGLCEIVEDGRSGYSVTVGDHLDLATRIAALLSDPELARSMGAAARRRAAGFDWAVVAEQTAQLYETAALSRPAAAPDGSYDDLLSELGEEMRRRITDLVTTTEVRHGG